MLAMDPAGIAQSLIAARIGRAQLAVAARLLSQESGDGAAVAKLIAAANQNMEKLAAATPGTGAVLDRLA
jgi:hypothetical protein